MTEPCSEWCPFSACESCPYQGGKGSQLLAEEAPDGE